MNTYTLEEGRHLCCLRSIPQERQEAEGKKRLKGIKFFLSLIIRTWYYIAILILVRYKCFRE
ncbi:MAG: hypothetical protein F6K17_37710 [Okeania sp. SIO3C4]|nr:hypothetical protein [Okeania sp. SIO3B3]NER07885.1 hypothetical protein [Okeania sp. SIO3C4]